ncbi:pyridoxamine 5'-phosphate oxidase family protein [Dysosmobacter sp. Sow4_B12]|uniref:pyridoxamine 5'-phosphate oxidase family protein n=1 Tax=Dysosmobacter sp. Sow4_B12 TaxID=3438777 RepID=UPI003F930E0C
MFREMRRKMQALTAEETAEILKRNTSGVLSLNGDDGYPYGVPLSYVYLDSKLYFHCAGAGHKLDSILKDDKVSFCVIDQDQVVGEEYTTYFRSVIAFGRARVLEGAEKLRPLVELCEKYYPGHLEQTRQKAEHALKNVSIVEVTIEHMTGKTAMELVKK